MKTADKQVKGRPKVKHTLQGRVSVSCSKELYAKIETAAKSEARSISNWMLCAAKEKLASFGSN